MTNRLVPAKTVRMLGISCGAFCALVAMSCATVKTRPADLDRAPQGVRIYPPKVLLLVDAEENRSTIALLPDYERAYDIKPVTVLARQEFSVKLADGQLQSMEFDQDTTAAVSLIRDAAQTAAQAAGLATSTRTINGAFGLESGLYMLERDGLFRRMDIAP